MKISTTDLTVRLGDRRYLVERRWCKPADDEPFGFISDIVVDSRGNVHVGHRGTASPVLVFDPSGAFVRSWGQGEIADIHYMSITRDDLILVADRDAHQILACNTDGSVEFRLGERHQPRWQAPFNHPTSASMSPDGEIFVSDGYGNFAVHRFAADGRHLRTWGRPGQDAGEFSTPHCVHCDRNGRILVADRENNRVQVFEHDGGWLDHWTGFYHPMKIFSDIQGHIYVTDQVPSISVLDSAGALIGRCRGTINGAHGLSGDADGNLYLAELPPEQVTRLALAD